MKTDEKTNGEIGTIPYGDDNLLRMECVVEDDNRAVVAGVFDYITTYIINANGGEMIMPSFKDDGIMKVSEGRIYGIDYYNSFNDGDGRFKGFTKTVSFSIKDNLFAAAADRVDRLAIRYMKEWTGIIQSAIDYAGDWQGSPLFKWWKYNWGSPKVSVKFKFLIDGMKPPLPLGEEILQRRK